jgi:hypothetical protein
VIGIYFIPDLREPAHTHHVATWNGKTYDIVEPLPYDGLPGTAVGLLASVIADLELIEICPVDPLHIPKLFGEHFFTRPI